MDKLYKILIRLMLFAYDDRWCYHSGCSFFKRKIFNKHQSSTKCKGYRDIKLNKNVLGLPGISRAHSLGDKSFNPHISNYISQILKEFRFMTATYHHALSKKIELWEKEKTI